jgi:diguanylate cyclase (GGDEF)-like protein
VSPRTYTHALIALAVLVMAGGVWFSGRTQRDVVTESFRESEAVGQLMTSMLNQETGLRGYLHTGRADFLEPFMTGENQFDEILADARAAIPEDDRGARALLKECDRIAASWHERARDAVDTRRTTGRSDIDDAVRRKALMDQFRRTHARLRSGIEQRRSETLGRASTQSALLILGLSVIFTVGGWLTFGRRAQARARRRRAELGQRERQTNFAHTLQFMDSEEDAHALVKRHLEASVGVDTRVTVLRRNNSADRLELATPADGPIADAVLDAQPRSCLAVRLGTLHEGGEADALLSCELCGKTVAELTTCTPLLVQGEVIGSVLVAHQAPLDDIERQYVEDTVTQAAPVVANMRNLAIAELRAATDALTGLANRRAIQDTLRRMVAQALRAEQSLAAIAMDLDHFKQVNDRFGHDKGDDVLAAAAQTLTSTLRTSDFVGRQGGEEFIVLLPDTDLDGALVAAENLRAEIARIAVPGVDQPITASFGVAVLPSDALDADGLLRHADRALYTAKDRGRDRVAAAGVSPHVPA